MKKIYLDNGSTSFPKAPGVGQAMADFIEKSGVNVGRGSYAEAYNIGTLVYETRRKLSLLFNHGNPDNVAFTSGVTQGLNAVIRGLLNSGDRFIISGMEHNSVARVAEDLKGFGIEYHIAKCDSEGRIDFNYLNQMDFSNIKLFVLNHVSNVSGTIQDVERIGNLCREKDVMLVLDAAQSGGSVPIDFEKFNLSALCLTGHKGLLGPQGIGAVLLSEKAAKLIRPFNCGGTGSRSDSLLMPEYMPDKLEAGTQNLPGIIGLSKGLDYIIERGVDSILEHERRLARIFIEGIESIDKIKIIGPKKYSLRNGTVSIDFLEEDNGEISYVLEEDYGILTRCALHCAPLAHKSLGTFPKGTVRFSFGPFNEESHAIEAIKAIREITGHEN